MPPDHFSAQAQDYARSRPSYPPALFEFLAALTPGRHLALDCATGNGQAAIALAQHFETVIATDLSLAQLQEARPAANIHYLQASAEALPLKDASVQLITCAQAWHWFAHADFEGEALRVLRPGGYLAIWGYNLLRISPALDDLITHFYSHTLNAYWPDERRILEAGYASFPLMLQAIPTPEFAMTANWPLARLLQYLRSWSATVALQKAQGDVPVRALEAELTRAWGDAPLRPLTWPLTFRLGRKPLLS